PTNIYQISAGSLSLTGGDQRILVGAFNDGTGTLTISGTGQIEAQSIVLGESATAVGTMNLDGGRVVTDFIKTGAAAAGTQTMNLNGGTIEARVDAAQGLTGNLPANLLAGGVTFDVPDAAWTASTSGIMTGVGSLTKTGPGRLTVLGDQQYTGDTIVEGGILRLDDPYLDPASDIYLTTGVLLELDFESQIDVGTIYLDGVPQPAGVYDNTSALIAGAGSLNSTTGPSPGGDVVVDSFTLDTSGPTRMAVIEITGTPNSDYVCKASTDLTNFVTVGTETTDGSGNATFSVEADETAEFFIVEDAPN
ncbi:MAG: autotransporter-associated beta strand repeat-containing protein, partial [Haloferula sp.]